MTAYLTRPLNRGQVNATSTLLPLLPTLLSLPVSTYSSISLSQLSIQKNYYCLTASHIFSNKGIVSHTYPWKRSTGMQHINGQVSKRELTRLTSWFQPLLLTPILNKAEIPWNSVKLCEKPWSPTHIAIRMLKSWPLNEYQVNADFQSTSDGNEIMKKKISK